MSRVRLLSIVAVLAMLVWSVTAHAQTFPVLDEDEFITNIIGEIELKRVRQGENLSFLVSSPNAPDPNIRLAARNLPSGATFTPLANGYGQFSWTPLTGQEGEYLVTFAEEARAKSISGLVLQQVPLLAAGYPLSHGIYRVPYGNGEDIFVSRDHVSHNPPVKEDWVALNGGPLAQIPVVAAADGRIRSIVDHNTVCCADNANNVNCSACNNSVWIEHSNGEWTKYSHFQTGTVTGVAGLDTNDCVVEGQLLGYEGQIGHTSGNDAVQTVCSTPLVDTTKRCGIHLHWEVRFNQDAAHLRVPILCGVGGYIAYEDDVLIAEACDGIGCPTNFILGAQVLSGTEITVYKADVAIISEQTLIGSTSTAYFAGQSVTLTPGFHAYSGTYFHAMIKDCEVGPQGCPPE